jgi:hypothetical protein
VRHYKCAAKLQDLPATDPLLAQPYERPTTYGNQLYSTSFATAAGRAAQKLTWQRDKNAARRRGTILVGYGAALLALGWPGAASQRYLKMLQSNLLQ